MAGSSRTSEISRPPGGGHPSGHGHWRCVNNQAGRTGIKPANILVRRSDRQLVLIDFGAAKQAVAEHSRSLAPYTEGYACGNSDCFVRSGPHCAWHTAAPFFTHVRWHTETHSRTAMPILLSRQA